QAHTALPAGGQAVKCRAADHDRVSPTGESLDDVTAPAEAAVGDDHQPVADSRDDIRKDLYGSDATVQLPPTMVREHDPIATQIRGTLRVGNAQHALDDELALPVAADPGNVIPGDRGGKQLRNDGAAADGRGSLRWQEGLEVAKSRHALTDQDVAHPAGVAQGVQHRSQGRFAR